MSGAFSFLRCKKEKAQYVKVLEKDEEVRGRRKKLFPKSFVFSPVIARVLVMGIGLGLMPAGWGDERAGVVMDEVWEAVAKFHYDPEFAAKNRERLYEAFRPEVLLTGNDGDLAVVLNRMLRQIGDSHIVLYPPPGVATDAVKRKLAEGPALVAADGGFAVLNVGGRVLVARVESGSGAEKSGLRMGDEVLAVDGIEIRPEEPIYPAWSYQARALLGHGEPGSLLKLQVKSGGEVRVLEFPRRANGGKFFQVGYMPRLAMVYESRMLDGDIGYVKFNLFTPEAVMALRKDLKEKLAGAKGLVIDLRGNPGGLIDSALWMVSWLSRQEIDLGKMKVAGTALELKSTPQKRSFGGKLAVLTDGDSASCAEIVAAAIQDAGAGKIVGGKTPGFCLPSQFIELPSGFRLQTVLGDGVRANGKRIEGVGVTPDIAAPATPASLAAGHDPGLEAAVAELQRELK